MLSLNTARPCIGMCFGCNSLIEYLFKLDSATHGDHCLWPERCTLKAWPNCSVMFDGIVTELRARNHKLCSNYRRPSSHVQPPGLKVCAISRKIPIQLRTWLSLVDDKRIYRGIPIRQSHTTSTNLVISSETRHCKILHELPICRPASLISCVFFIDNLALE